MFKRPATVILAIVAAVVAAACATNPSSIDAQWVSPEYAGKRAIRSMMVMSAVRDSTTRRLFEDRMVGALAQAGVKAVQSYKLIPEDGPVSEQRIRAAVNEAGVDYAMVAAIINVSQQVDVSPGFAAGPAWGPGWGWGGGWGPGWGGFAGYYNTMWATIPPQITVTQNVNADTRVFDAQNAAVVWSAATTTSTGRGTVPQIIDQFVQLIVEAMVKDGVI